MALQNRLPQILGTPFSSSGASTVSTNAAANWAAHSFIPPTPGLTLSDIRVYVSAIGGTLGASDITADLYDSTGSNGAPGSSIETGKLPSATITAAGYYTFTGFTTALTAHTPYWIVFKNVNGTPATNFATFRFVTGTPFYTMGNIAARTTAWLTGSSTNSGGAWSTNTNRSGLRVGYSGGLYDGFPGNNAAFAAVGDGVYSTRESGILVTTPNATLRVAGVAYQMSKTGTPTGNLRFGLWTGTTPVNLAYTDGIPNAIALSASTSYMIDYFTTVQIVPPRTVLRITIGESTQSDASGNRFGAIEVSWDTDSNSIPLLPWDGTCQKTYFDGSSWTDTTIGTSFFACVLLLDCASDFALLPVGNIVGARSIGTY